MKYLVVCIFLALSACVNPLGLLSGGPNVAADVQVGKENTQQIVANQTTTQAGGDVIQQDNPILANQIKEVTVQQTPFWMLLLLVLGWLLPSPNEIARWIRGLFKR